MFSQITKQIKASLGHLVLKICGYSCDKLPEGVGNKFVLVGFPHNSNMDALYGVCFCLVNHIRTYSLIKKEWMFWPMSWIFKIIGTVAVDRRQPGGLVAQVAEEFKKRTTFRLVIFPEGTRSRVKQIKTGFWHIAEKANVPMVFLFKNEVKKRLVILETMLPSQNIQEDLMKMQEIYARVNFTELDFLASFKQNSTTPNPN